MNLDRRESRWLLLIFGVAFALTLTLGKAGNFLGPLLLAVAGVWVVGLIHGMVSRYLLRKSGRLVDPKDRG